MSPWEIYQFLTFSLYFSHFNRGGGPMPDNQVIEYNPSIFNPLSWITGDQLEAWTHDCRLGCRYVSHTAASYQDVIIHRLSEKALLDWVRVCEDELPIELPMLRPTPLSMRRVLAYRSAIWSTAFPLLIDSARFFGHAITLRHRHHITPFTHLKLSLQYLGLAVSTLIFGWLWPDDVLKNLYDHLKVCDGNPSCPLRLNLWMRRAWRWVKFTSKIVGFAGLIYGFSSSVRDTFGLFNVYLPFPKPQTLMAGSLTLGVGIAGAMAIQEQAIMKHTHKGGLPHRSHRHYKGLI